MLASTLMFAGLIALANAHFQLEFPIPRGPFVEDNEPTFCDGYTNVTPNRTIFPLTGGFFTLNSEHPSWTAFVTLSTTQNSTNFQDFSSITPFLQASGEGKFCLPLDFSKTNATGLTDGQNITLEFVYDGGDGELFQCADLTLSSTAKISSDISCQNGTSTTSASGTGASATSPAGSSTASSKPSSALDLRFHGEYLAVVLALFVGFAAVLV
ncbi:hypothetical protein B0H11DRAFT_2128432 [Mycena galericulata]|nr:hypothetical protein B0H11DRAFT_2128432 [Mycena galericulata]